MAAGYPVADLPVPLTAGDAFTIWQFAPAVSAGLIAAAAGYLLCAWRVGRRHPARPWPAGRALAFLLGLAVIAAATQSSIGAYDDVLFSDHMIQHLLLIMVAPPLLVFGRPVTLLLHASRNPLHTWVKRIIRSRAVTVLTWPPGAVGLYCAVVAGTHLTPPFMDLVLENGTVHDAEHALYLVTGYLYFLPLAGSEPIRWRVALLDRFALLLATMPVDTAVGIILTMVPHEIFPAYARDGRTWGPSPVADLHAGGWIMFIGSDLVMSVLAIIIAVRFVYDPREGGRPGHWVERLRRATLLRDIAAAGVTVRGAGSGTRGPGGARRTGDRNHRSHGLRSRTIDDDAYLDAYNAYLGTLSEHAQRQDGGWPDW